MIMIICMGYNTFIEMGFYSQAVDSYYVCNMSILVKNT